MAPDDSTSDTHVVEALPGFADLTLRDQDEVRKFETFLRARGAQKAGAALDAPALTLAAVYGSPTGEDGDAFDSLVAQWHRETGALSNPHKIIAHPAYRAIVAMGWSAVPLILADLTATDDPDMWGPALREITGEDVEIAPEYAGRLDVVARAWLTLADRLGWRR